MNTGFYRVAASSPEIYLGDCVNNADNIIHIAELLAKRMCSLWFFRSCVLRDIAVQTCFEKRTARAGSARTGQD